MSELLDAAPLVELDGTREVVTASTFAARVARRKGTFHAIGVQGSAAAWVARALAHERRVVYVTHDFETARHAADDLAFYASSAWGSSALTEATTLLFTPSEASPYADIHPERQSAMLRLGTLFHLAKELPFAFLVLSAAALVRRTVPKRVLLDGTFRLVAEDAIDLERLVAGLSASGYLRTPVVEDPGCFAVRGGLLDVWPPGLDAPVRAELYGDLVISLRLFDAETQRTTEQIADAWLVPAREAILGPDVVERARNTVRSLADAVNLPSTKARRLADDVAEGRQFYGGDGFLPAYYDLSTLFEYIPDDAIVAVEDPARVVRAIRDELEAAGDGAARREGSPHFPVESLFTGADEVARELDARTTVALHRVAVGGGAAAGLSALEIVPDDAPSLATRDLSDLERATASARTARGKHGVLDPLVERLALWTEHHMTVALAARTASQAERLATLLAHRDVAVVTDRPHAGSEVAAPIGGHDADRTTGLQTRIRIVVGPLSRGAIVPADGVAFVTEEEIFGHRTHQPAKKKRAARALLEDLRRLAPGDYVVHVDHGVGKYLGLEKRTIGGVTVDLLTVEYLDGDKLFLPVHRLNQIEKYSGGDGAPRIDKLGGQTFAKTKSKVRRRVREMADELLRLYAQRNALKKVPLPAPDDEYRALEASFPYEETRDQASAIAEVMADLTSDKVSDRLVCGDVGFGKTEVALRAAFLTILAGRQVALLCPTTVLAQQHYLTFSRRLKDFAVSVHVLSRFESKREQEETLRGLKAGAVDIVIGTHRLLSKDVHLKNLGLLVIDEEQRFGVAHKERLKQLRTNVDVLTLTATPIPRTLQLAVGGLRDMSVITTPPADRRSIRTIASQVDPLLIRDAVLRELARGGQVFYVHNRVEGLYERAARLREIVPEARVAVAHGQLDEATLEQTMLDFVEGKFDVLASTAIIESGLDIPRANTMIVDRADLFGLSQLYQLRGRIGRSSERAYCYLLLPPPSELTDEARSRIEALERYTELGSGFHVATLDMEIRGAGNVLGGEQSGFVASVGFDLFCQMLEEATHELRGEVVVHDVDPELTFDVEALLPESYVGEVGVRLSLYKRLAGAQDEAEVDDAAAEMEDRFGEAPPSARRLIDLMRQKVELRRLCALGCEATATTATLHLREDTPLDPEKVGRLVAAKKSGYRVTPDMRLTRRARDGETFRNGIELVDRMLAELAECRRDGPASNDAVARGP